MLKWTSPLLETQKPMATTSLALSFQEKSSSSDEESRNKNIYFILCCLYVAIARNWHHGH